MKLGPLLMIIFGITVIGIGATLAAVGGAGELAYYQCIANSSTQCTSGGNNQYITVFLANNDLLTIGMNLLSVGIIILLAGIVTNYITMLNPTTVGSVASDRTVVQSQQNITAPRNCLKCGSHVIPTSKFCGFCGSSLS